MHVSLPFRIRPSRTRLLMRICVLCFSTMPIMWLLWDHRHELLGMLGEPSWDGRYIVALGFAAYVVSCAVALLAFCLEALPGAPFRHIDVDTNGVTTRYWFVTRRILHRDMDGWGVMEQALQTRNAEWPKIRWHLYSVVAGHGVNGGQRVHPQRNFPVTVDATVYSPLFTDRQQFASLLAGFLSDCKNLRGKRAVADVPEPLAAQTFARSAVTPRAPKPSRPKKPHARMPGRFPTNEDMAAYWSGQAIQSMRAADDLPAFDRAATRADLHAQLARRDRKRRAREKREAAKTPRE